MPNKTSRGVFQIHINTKHRLNSLKDENELLLRDFKANLLIQSTRCWEGLDAYILNGKRERKIAYNADLDVGVMDQLQN